MSTVLIVDVRDSVLTLKLNRPERLNILDVNIRKEILKILEKYRKNSSIRCVVFRAEGKAFSAGADLKYLLSLNYNQARRYVRFVRNFLKYIEEYPKPTIGVVQGIAVGGGLELLLVLDIVIATEKASFGQTELNVGLIPGGGGTQRLANLIGLRKAKEMVFTGKLISAVEAKEIGIVNFVVSEGNLENELDNILKKIINKRPELIKISKEAMNFFCYNGLKRGLEFESKEYLRVLNRVETKREIKKFLEKKKL